MIKLVDFILFICIQTLSAIFYHIPIRVTLKIGRFLGSVAFYLYTSRRRIVHSNMRAAFSDEKTPEQIRQMVKEVYKSIAENFIEILALRKVNKAYVKKYMKLINMKNAHDAFALGKGVILLTAHLGNWEMGAKVVSLQDFPIYFLAREQKLKRVNAFINEVRESTGGKVIQKGYGIRSLIKILREGNLVALLSDQNGPAGGKLALFFGRPVPTVEGPYVLSQRLGATILPVFMKRKKGPYHSILLGKPFVVDKKDNIIDHMQRYNDGLESVIREKPSQWLWTHRRWKKTPLRKIAVLSDSKAGHLNQSLSIAQTIQKYRNNKGLSHNLTELKIIKIEFKNKFWGNMVNLYARFSCVYTQGRLGMLKKALTEQSYKKVSSLYADIIISTGASLEGLNVILKNENNARNVICMNPSSMSIKKFDLVILGEHDLVKKKYVAKNIVKMSIVPNLVNEQNLEKAKKELLKDLKFSKNKILGVLFGGDNKLYFYDDKMMKIFCENIKTICIENDMGLVLTTSRRTSTKQQHIIKDMFKDIDSHIIIANEKNPEYAVNGILGLSDIVIVSSESISMVSEAVSSKKPVMVFKGNKNTQKLTKYDIFLNNLEAKGCLKYMIDTDIKDIDSLSFEDIKKNHDNLYNAMERLKI